MNVVVAAQSTTDVFNAVWGGLAILAVLLVAAFGFIVKQISTVKTDLAAAITASEGRVKGDIERVEGAAERRFDKLERTTDGIKESLQDVSVRLVVFEAREDERARLQMEFRRANSPEQAAPPAERSLRGDRPAAG